MAKGKLTQEVELLWSTSKAEDNHVGDEPEERRRQPVPRLKRISDSAHWRVNRSKMVSKIRRVRLREESSCHKSFRKQRLSKCFEYWCRRPLPGTIGGNAAWASNSTLTAFSEYSKCGVVWLRATCWFRGADDDDSEDVSEIVDWVVIAEIQH